VLSHNRAHRRVNAVRLRPREPRTAVGAGADLHEAGLERAVERRDVVLARGGIGDREADPSLGQLVLVKPAGGEQLQGGLLHVALGAVELFEQ
jgi:hypothetical protein